MADRHPSLRSAGFWALLLAGGSHWSCAPGPRPAATPAWVSALRNGDATRELRGSRSVKLTLGGSTRNAFVADQRLAFELDLPPQASLELGSALRCAEGTACRGEVKFRARVTRPGLPDLVQGWTQRADWREENPAGQPQLGEPAGWRVRQLPLAHLGPGRVRVELESDPAEPPGAAAPVAFWSEPLLLAAAAKRPNVVVVSLDALRPDRLGCYGSRAQLSPHIDRLARGAVRFESAVSSAPWTTPAHMSLFTSLDPSHHHVMLGPAEGRQRSLAAHVPTLAGRLREHGYRTIAVTGGATVAAALDFDRGFDVYVDGPLKLTPQSRAGVLAQLRAAQPAPFFLFVHSFETHAPYSRNGLASELLTPQALADWAHHVEPVDWLTRVGDRTLGTPAARSAPEDSPALSRLRARARVARAGAGVPGRAPAVAPDPAAEEALSVQAVLERHGAFRRDVASALYDGGVRHADAFVGELLDELVRLGLEHNTVVVLTSDHGEEFGEHDPHRFWDSHCVTQYDELLRVPLILRLPGISARVLPQQARLVDVMPTLLDWLGLPLPERLDGRSLLPFVAGDRLPPVWALSEATCFAPELKALRNEEYKYIAELERGVPTVRAKVRLEWLFRLTDDRHEHRDISRRERALTVKLRRHLLALTRSPERRPPAAPPGPQPPELIEGLKSLGYVD